MHRLDRAFFARETPDVSRDLLGKILVVRGCAGMIVETEAYHGLDDAASHAAKGQPRARIMFEHPGAIYTYISYGLHVCMNVVCRERGEPGAVLLRAVLPLAGVEEMRVRRGSVPDAILADGPGKLCQAMGVTMADYGRDAVADDELYFADMGFAPERVETTPRIGITQNIDVHWRYLIPKRDRRLPGPEALAALTDALRAGPRSRRRSAR